MKMSLSGECYIQEKEAILTSSDFTSMCISLAHSPPIFTVDMTTYYCHTLEEVLKRAKAAGKKPGCRYCGIILKNGKRGFAVYKEGIVIEQYSVIGRKG